MPIFWVDLFCVIDVKLHECFHLAKFDAVGYPLVGTQTGVPHFFS